MKTEIVKLSQIAVNEANPRMITEAKMSKLINSLLSMPAMLQIRPIVVDNTNTALGGNMRYRALCAIAEMSAEELAQRLHALPEYQRKTKAEQEAFVAYWGAWQDNPTAPIVQATELSEDEQRAFIIKDNVGFGDWDYDALANEWDSKELDAWGVDVWQSPWEDDKGGSEDWDDGSGNSQTDTHNGKNNEGKLQRIFVVPPFSVLDSRQGYWQQRKNMWRDKIGDTRASREMALGHGLGLRYRDLYTKTEKHRKSLGISFKEYLDNYVSEYEKQKCEASVMNAGVSLFDPVLAEVVCKWFTPYLGAEIFDCFAGDTQKGIVFGECGFKFKGIELRQEQVDANNETIEGRNLPVKYICDDGRNVANHFEPESQDLLFSCPPYYDLEKYSTLPNDASAQKTYDDFINILEDAFKAAYTRLKENRFIVIVLGDVRNKKNGAYYDFGGDIKRIFKACGAHLYNELILVEMAASSAIRAEAQMKTRKVCKTHQNILVFFKGDTNVIKTEFDRIELTDEEEQAIHDLICGDINNEEQE